MAEPASVSVVSAHATRSNWAGKHEAKWSVGMWVENEAKWRVGGLLRVPTLSKSLKAVAGSICSVAASVLAPRSPHT